MTPRDRANGLLPLLRHKGYDEYDVDPEGLAAGIAAEIDDAVREERAACHAILEDVYENSGGISRDSALRRAADRIRSRGAAPEKPAPAFISAHETTYEPLPNGDVRVSRRRMTQAEVEALGPGTPIDDAELDSPEKRHPCIECGNDYAEGYCPHEKSKADPVPPEVHDSLRSPTIG